ncbi:MAG: thiamine pyrophosphate-dependent enzyme [Burkholderiaceae bacterium]
MPHASLDRCAVAAITDGFAGPPRRHHQWYDQRALYAPIVKAHSDLVGATTGQIGQLVGLALAPRQGPVHLELTAGGKSRRRAIGCPRAIAAGAAAPLGRQRPGAGRRLVAAPAGRSSSAGSRPAMPPAPRPCAPLTRALGCPALVTYKAKGVIADHDDACRHLPAVPPRSFGDCAKRPVDHGRPRSGRIDPPTVAVRDRDDRTGLAPHPRHYLRPTVSCFGPLTDGLAALSVATASDWSTTAIARLRDQTRDALRYGKVADGVSPEQVVTLAARQAAKLPQWPRATVDAGAHMFSATTFWPCAQPNDLLISNGLATMGFALPAGIAAALHEPSRPVIAFTGDGGLLMCAGELATAVEQQVRLIVIVFNDGALSLIDIKQQQRQLPAAGVRWAPHDFAAMMKAFGGLGLRARTAASYSAALRRALQHDGPSLIDVQVDPSGYPEQLRALRG